MPNVILSDKARFQSSRHSLSSNTAHSSKFHSSLAHIKGTFKSHLNPTTVSTQSAQALLLLIAVKHGPPTLPQLVLLSTVNLNIWNAGTGNGPQGRLNNPQDFCMNWKLWTGHSLGKSMSYGLPKGHRRMSSAGTRDWRVEDFILLFSLFLDS